MEMLNSVKKTTVMSSVRLQLMSERESRVIPQENAYIIANTIDSLLGARKSQPKGKSKVSHE